MAYYSCIIADDDTMCRLALKRLFLSYPSLKIVTVCKTGSELLEALASYEVDIVFLDMNMPGMAGVQLLTYIESGIHVVITTGDESVCDHALPRAISFWASKPITHSKLDQALASIAAGKSRQQEGSRT